MQNKKACVLTTVHTASDNRIYNKQIKSLAKAGYQVSFIVQSELEKPVFNEDGVKIVPLPLARNRFHRVFCLTGKALFKAIAEKAHIYHFHDPELIPTGLLLKLLRCQVIYDIHEDYATSILQKKYLPGILKTPLAYLFGLFEKISAKAFKIILAENYYSKKYPKGTMILNYPQLAIINSSTSHHKADIPRLLYTGVVTEDRGALIHANILNYIEAIELTVVGRCSQQLAKKMYNVVQSNQERLVLVGVEKNLSFSEILSYYNKNQWTAGLALFPLTEHYKEKQLTKFFEYMAAGIPVICSNFPAWKSLIEGENVGITADPLNIEEIVEAINKLYENINLR